ncbi:hypothetical protein JXL21_12150 [Candidatus Bathyarchaeota archaeon]|nr:hypothetical protein [Candidatus Bathyarchaeota archaeon]
MIEIKTIRDGFGDVFKVCSPQAEPGSKLMDGRCLRERWLRETLIEYGPFIKVAYLDGLPISQIMYYPEEALPYLSNPRQGVIRIECVYSRVQGKGAGSRLLSDLVSEAKKGLESLKGEPCLLLVAEPFATGEGLSLKEFYGMHGFKEGEDEMYLEVHGEYKLRKRPMYTPLPEDAGKAIVFYNVNCEHSYSFAGSVEKLIQEVSPGYPVETLNQWERPAEAARRGNELVIVNQRPIKSFWRTPEFKSEVQAAIENR